MESVFDPNKNYDFLSFKTGKPLQAAELNEIQLNTDHRLNEAFGAIHKDGDLIEGCLAYLSEDKKKLIINEGKVFLAGRVRKVSKAVVPVTPSGEQNVGVWLVQREVTALEDRALYEQAREAPTFMMDGASRIQMTPFWGRPEDNIKRGTFYPVFLIEEGRLLSKAPPPTLSGVSRAISQYDRDSAGGTYIVEGLNILVESDRYEDKQYIQLQEGVARVDGHAVYLPTSSRIAFDKEKFISPVQGEIHEALENGTKIVIPHRQPVENIYKIRVKQRTEKYKITKGEEFGVDGLPQDDDEVPIKVETVFIGSGSEIRVFTRGKDYEFTGVGIKWLRGGESPSSGSTYYVTYIKNVTYFLGKWEGDEEPKESSDKKIKWYKDGHIDVLDAVPESTIVIEYEYPWPRIDRFCLDFKGRVQRIKGIAHPHKPIPPPWPMNMLSLATVRQTWKGEPEVSYFDAVRAVSMQNIQEMRRLIYHLYELMAEDRLKNDINEREPFKKRGVFADPFLDNKMRDLGLEQDAAIINGTLTLPMEAKVHDFSTPTISLDGEDEAVIEQLFATGSEKVNPYLALEPIPCSIECNPAVDRWQETREEWLGEVVRRFSSRRTTTSGSSRSEESTSSSIENVSTTTQKIAFMRPIDVRFKIIGFDDDEDIESFLLDSREAKFKISDKKKGILRGSFEVPEGVPAGSKKIEVYGSQGNIAIGSFTSQGTLTIRQMRRVRSITTTFVQRVDPQAQTFTLEESRFISGVEVIFTEVGSHPLVCQLRTCELGFPTQEVLAETRLLPSDIKVNEFTKLSFEPVFCEEGKEFAFIIMSDEEISAIKIAQIGKYDSKQKVAVTRQPYLVGTMLSSSNASTWTPKQDQDITFKLLAHKYKKKTKEIKIGEFQTENMSDIMALLSVELPSVETTYNVVVKNNEYEFLLIDNEPLQLDDYISGDFEVFLRIQGTESLTPLVYPGIQIITGHLKQQGTYISREIPCDPVNPSRVSVSFLASDLNKGNVKVFLEGQEGWVEIQEAQKETQIGERKELTYESEISSQSTRVKLILEGEPSARMEVTKLRGVSVDDII